MENKIKDSLDYINERFSRALTKLGDETAPEDPAEANICISCE